MNASGISSSSLDRFHQCARLAWFAVPLPGQSNIRLTSQQVPNNRLKVAPAPISMFLATWHNTRRCSRDSETAIGEQLSKTMLPMWRNKALNNILFFPPLCLPSEAPDPCAGRGRSPGPIPPLGGAMAGTTHIFRFRMQPPRANPLQRTLHNSLLVQ